MAPRRPLAALLTVTVAVTGCGAAAASAPTLDPVSAERIQDSLARDTLVLADALTAWQRDRGTPPDTITVNDTGTVTAPGSGDPLAALDSSHRLQTYTVTPDGGFCLTLATLSGLTWSYDSAARLYSEKPCAG